MPMAALGAKKLRPAGEGRKVGSILYSVSLNV